MLKETQITGYQHLKYLCPSYNTQVVACKYLKIIHAHSIIAHLREEWTDLIASTGMEQTMWDLLRRLKIKRPSSRNMWGFVECMKQLLFKHIWTSDFPLGTSQLFCLHIWEKELQLLTQTRGLWHTTLHHFPKASWYDTVSDSDRVFCATHRVKNVKSFNREVHRTTYCEVFCKHVKQT